MDTQQTQTGKNFKTDSKRAAMELWRAEVPLATIRKQLKMLESTLRRILAVARNNPTLPIPHRKPVSGRPRKISQETMKLMKKRIQERPSIITAMLIVK
jgi:hypothetical protein